MMREAPSSAIALRPSSRPQPGRRVAERRQPPGAQRGRGSRGASGVVRPAHDVSTIAPHACPRLRADPAMPGGFEVSRAIEDIVLLAERRVDDEWERVWVSRDLDETLSGLRNHRRASRARGPGNPVPDALRRASRRTDPGTRSARREHPRANVRARMLARTLRRSPPERKNAKPVAHAYPCWTTMMINQRSVSDAWFIARSASAHRRYEGSLTCSTMSKKSTLAVAPIP